MAELWKSCDIYRAAYKYAKGEKMKAALIIACIGHIICGITDCMLAYMKNGRFEFSDVNDNKKCKWFLKGHH